MSSIAPAPLWGPWRVSSLPNISWRHQRNPLSSTTKTSPASTSSTFLDIAEPCHSTSVVCLNVHQNNSGCNILAHCSVFSILHLYRLCCNSTRKHLHTFSFQRYSLLLSLVSQKARPSLQPLRPPAAPSGPSCFFDLFDLQPLALRPSRSTQPCRPFERPCLCQIAPLVLLSTASEDMLQSPASSLCPPTALYVSSLFSSCGDVPPGKRRFPPRGFGRGSRNCAARAAQRPRSRRQNSSRAQGTDRIVGPLAT